MSVVGVVSARASEACGMGVTPCVLAGMQLRTATARQGPCVLARTGTQAASAPPPHAKTSHGVPVKGERLSGLSYLRQELQLLLARQRGLRLPAERQGQAVLRPQAPHHLHI